MINPSPRRLANGDVVYRVQYRLYPAANPTSDTFDTFEDAQQFCALIARVGPLAAREIRLATTRDANPVTADKAFEEFCAHTASYAEPQTVAKYRRLWDRHIGPEFGPWPVGQITKQHVQTWVGHLRMTETAASIARRESSPLMEEEYLSAKTIANIQGLLSSVLKLQIEHGTLQANPAKGVRLPKGMRKREPVFLTPSQRRALIEHAPDDWGLFVEFMLATGLRWGEALALFPTDFNFESAPATVRIDKAWKHTPNGMRLGTPKTQKSKRTVSIPAHLVPALRSLVSLRASSDLVFQGFDGGRIRDAWFYKRVWQPACQGAQLDPAPRIHDLRHTHASMLLAQNVPIHIVQQRLGHESIQTTVNVYGHLIPDAGRIAAQAAELALKQAC